MAQVYRWFLQDNGAHDARGDIAVMHLAGCGCTLDPFVPSGTIEADTAAAAAATAETAIEEAGGTGYEYADCVLSAIGTMVPAYATDLMSALNGVPMNAVEKASVFRLARHTPDSGALATLIRRARSERQQFRAELATMLVEWAERGRQAAAAQQRNDSREAMKHLNAHDQTAARIVTRLMEWMTAG
ncbi:hypothetical protein ETD86_40985 [Nonomuraea turkmeniaca]|uniref:Uncharacterized protein n=1 Tax=Nonomuraea turkmeniaca TaxID=103838 RepID=A0A5S4F294_9ACTN|nr:hypothetical protein [Nonomuraea turkmeniaca]TMR10103.1 hypothetical protein ETD86_40985 [Nonomuraea turkmeniaca]